MLIDRISAELKFVVESDGQINSCGFSGWLSCGAAEGIDFGGLNFANYNVFRVFLERLHDEFMRIPAPRENPLDSNEFANLFSSYTPYNDNHKLDKRRKWILDNLQRINDFNSGSSKS